MPRLSCGTTKGKTILMSEIFQLLETEIRRRREKNKDNNLLASAFITFDDLIEIVEECRFLAAEKEEEQLAKLDKYSDDLMQLSPK